MLIDQGCLAGFWREELAPAFWSDRSNNEFAHIRPLKMNAARALLISVRAVLIACGRLRNFHFRIGVHDRFAKHHAGDGDDAAEQWSPRKASAGNSPTAHLSCRY